LFRGNLGGAQVLRISRPGFSARGEPFGSAGIALDTRIADIGTVVAAGLIICGGGPVSFPAMSFVPIVKILAYTGGNLSDHVVIKAVAHSWLPAIALVTQSSIEVIAYTCPWVNTTAYYNPNGQYYSYYVFAAG
jgi:hypothetical protein